MLICAVRACFQGRSEVRHSQAAVSQGGYHRAPDGGTLAVPRSGSRSGSRGKNVLDPPAPIDGHKDELNLLPGGGGNLSN